MKKMVTLVCAGCGETFTRDAAQACRKDRPAHEHYCSVACRRARVDRVCEVCGKPFWVSRSYAENFPARWCSTVCADIGRKRGETRRCKVCGTEFYVFPGAAEGRYASRSIYCSRACYMTVIGRSLKGRERSPEHAANISKAKRGKPNLKLIKEPIPGQCLQCGATFQIRRNIPRALRAKVRFCSRECWYEYCREDPGRHPSYRGGYDPYYGPNWKKQAKLARERDNHTCQSCGKRQKRPLLDVHHIRPLRFFGGDYLAANDLANLVTLCKSCHSKVLKPLVDPANHRVPNRSSTLQ